MIKYGSAKIAGIVSTSREFKKEFGFDSFVKFSTLHKLDTERYLYLRNHAVSETEHWGPNENGDAFPRTELETNYQTFVGQRVSIDHQDDQVIGYVLSSKFIPWDEKTKNGGFVENILALDKKKTEETFPGLLDLILSGKVTDTSMGAVVGWTRCSICSNIATNENEFCDHVRNHKMQEVVLASGERKLVYEICYDVSFFEDSIIVPLHLGGKAGGEGADTRAKVLQIIASRIVDTEEPERLLRVIQASLPRKLADAFLDDLDEALSGSNPAQEAILVIARYSSYANEKGKKALSLLASILR